jgi:hypothetical protein
MLDDPDLCNSWSNKSIVLCCSAILSLISANCALNWLSTALRLISLGSMVLEEKALAGELFFDMSASASSSLSGLCAAFLCFLFLLFLEADSCMPSAASTGTLSFSVFLSFCGLPPLPPVKEEGRLAEPDFLSADFWSDIFVYNRTEW